MEEGGSEEHRSDAGQRGREKMQSGGLTTKTWVSRRNGGCRGELYRSPKDGGEVQYRNPRMEER